MARRDKDRLTKTNAMRELERNDIAYVAHSYDPDLAEESALSSDRLGLQIAELIGEDPDAAFKTLVTVAPSGAHVVCCIPVGSELDLKKAAAAAKEKSLAMMHVRDLEAVTGYVRGGCSPIGMKKDFPTLIDETALIFDEIGLSGGRRGLSLSVDPKAIAALIGATFVDITR